MTMIAVIQIMLTVMSLRVNILTFMIRKYLDLIMFNFSRMLPVGHAFRVTHSALYYSLRILKPFHPELPLDPRTLLRTQNSYAVKEMSNMQGHYYHFGIASGIDLDINWSS